MKYHCILSIIILALTSFLASESYGDSATVYLSLNHHLWMRTSYNNDCLNTQDYHFLYLPETKKIALELDWFHHTESKKQLQNMLAKYSGREQPFPLGFRSFRAKLYLNDINIKKNLLKINKLVLGNFLRNPDRYEYLDFSRYVLHSPLDIEQKRSLADWGFYSNTQIWKLNVEDFLLRSFSGDRTTGFQICSHDTFSAAIVLTPVINGVFDNRTDESYNLQYAPGADQTFSGGGTIQIPIKSHDLFLKPLFAFNKHEFLDEKPSRKGYLRNSEIIFRTLPCFEMWQFIQSCGIKKLGFQTDFIIEKNDADYHPNFAYDRDELNDDYLLWRHGISGCSFSDELNCFIATQQPGLLLNRENVNVRLAESGGEAGLSLQGYALRNDSKAYNVLNLGFRCARYSRTGDRHPQTYDDSELIDFSFKTLSNELELNAAYWQRRTNLVTDPDLTELKIFTSIVGLRYIFGRNFMKGRNGKSIISETIISIFFRTDNFIEKYKNDISKENGSIFMAALELPIFCYCKYRGVFQILYRKYVPDNHIITRIFPPNNTIRVSLNLATIR